MGHTVGMGDPPESNEAANSQSTAEPKAGESKLKRRLIIGVILLVAAVAAWFFGSAVIPRWWAQRVGEVVDGRLTFGSFLGVGVGTVFTILPLLTLRAGWKFRAGWQRWIKFVILALVLGAPNLATLGIVYGDGNAAHAGERILDVEGPGFRGGSLVGAILGLVVVVGTGLLLRSRRRNKEKVAGLKAELEQANNPSDD